MKTVGKTQAFKASAEVVFDHLDDLGVTGMHMTESSMPMMGGKMDLKFLSANTTGLNTKYRWTGKVLWMPLDFTVLVTGWKRGVRKTWETTGNARLIIYSWFRMNLDVKPANDTSIATLSISYEKPADFFGRVLCFFLGNWYCRWCINNMLNDVVKNTEGVALQAGYGK